jgi:hypothetical protein
MAKKKTKPTVEVVSHWVVTSNDQKIDVDSETCQIIDGALVFIDTNAVSGGTVISKAFAPGQWSTIELVRA